MQAKTCRRDLGRSQLVPTRFRLTPSCEHSPLPGKTLERVRRQHLVKLLTHYASGLLQHLELACLRLRVENQPYLRPRFPLLELEGLVPMRRKPKATATHSSG